MTFQNSIIIFYRGNRWCSRWLYIPSVIQLYFHNSNKISRNWLLSSLKFRPRRSTFTLKLNATINHLSLNYTSLFRDRKSRKFNTPNPGAAPFHITSLCPSLLRHVNRLHSTCNRAVQLESYYLLTATNDEMSFWFSISGSTVFRALLISSGVGFVEAKDFHQHPFDAN